MKVGDLVTCDNWVYSGKKGIIVKIQEVDYCKGVYVLFNTGIKLIRIGNVRIINDNW